MSVGVSRRTPPSPDDRTRRTRLARHPAASPASRAHPPTEVHADLTTLRRRYEELDEVLLGCLANDTTQAEALSSLVTEMSRARGELDRLGRLIEALGRIVLRQHRENERRDAELELIAERQDILLRQLTLLSVEPGLDDATTELGPEERAALFRRAGLEH